MLCQLSVRFQHLSQRDRDSRPHLHAPDRRFSRTLACCIGGPDPRRALLQGLIEEPVVAEQVDVAESRT
jgi:hypothetical protein